MQSFTEAELEAFLDKEMGKYAEDLSELIRIKSISQDPSQIVNLDAVLDKIGAKVRVGLQGFETTMLQARDGGRRYPVLFATFEGEPGAEEVVAYNHADVQPEMDLAKWKGEAPFSGAHGYNVIKGRGATDDKGPLLAVLYALKFLIQRDALKNRITLMYETGEESGSPGIEAVVQEARDRKIIRNPSHVFVSDTEFKEGHPNDTVSLRGIVTLHLGLSYASGTIHSGIYGDIVPNPLEILPTLILHLKNVWTGQSYVGNAQDLEEDRTDVATLREAAQYLTAEGLRNAAGAYALRTNDVLTALKKVGLHPTLTLHNIAGGVEGTGVPASAEASVSMRLVEGQDPEQAVREFMQDLNEGFARYTREEKVPQLYGGVERAQRSIDPHDPKYKRLIFPGKPCTIEVEVGHKIGAFKTGYDTPYHRLAHEAYRKAGFEKEPVRVLDGGTIGAMTILQKAFGKELPFVLFALSRDDDGYHQEQEHFHLDHARKAIKAAVHYFAGLQDVAKTA